MTASILCLLSLLARPIAHAAAPIAIFSEPDFPYYIASPAVSPEFVQQGLKGAGIEATLVSADQFADPAVFHVKHYPVLAYVYGNAFPVAALENLRRFHTEKGCVVAFGGVPFCHPCVKEGGKWVDKIDEMGWEFVSHDEMGTGIWGQADDVDAVVHAPGDPLGIAWLPLPGAPPGVVQFPRLGMTLQESKAAGYDHLLGLPPEDRVIPVVSVTKAGVAVGHPVCVIEHHCPELNGAVDLWAGATLSPSFSMQQQEQLIVASCAYLLERAGVMAPERRREVLAVTRGRYAAPITEAPPREGPFILRATPPAKRLIVLDVQGLSSAEQMLALTLQGIVNRKQPRVYVVGDFKDAAWLEVLRREGHESRGCDGLQALTAMFRDELAGAVVYDPADGYTVNIATMLAGLRGSVIATPELATRYRLRVLDDLRGRFASAMDAYEWALEELWPQLEHRAVACMAPGWVAPRDTLVQFRLFTFWLDCQCSKPLPWRQALFLEKLLAKMPPHGLVYGWWQDGDDGGIGEWRGVMTSSRYAKITVCTVGAYNLSVHSGVKMPGQLAQRRIQFGSLGRKVYVTFIVSDGDNFGMDLYGVIGRLWSQKMRGKVPVGWGICPTQVELSPAAVRYWYETATSNDLFVCMDGLGYVYPSSYGAGLGDGKAYYGEFLRQTQPYLTWLDQRHLWFLDGTPRAGQMAETLKLDGLFGEYGVFPEQRQALLGQTAALWVDVNPWEKPWDDVGTYVKRIRERTPKQRPAFLLVGVNGFCIGPNEIAQILRDLGPDYIAVRPDELCHLYRKYQTSGVDANPAPRPPLDLRLPLSPGPYVNEKGILVVREDDGDPDISGWFTDPQGTQWVRKRLNVPLPAGAKQAVIQAFVRGEKGNHLRLRLNGQEHEVALRSSSWEWASVTVPAIGLRNGENEIAYTGNPGGRLLTAGDASTDLGHSDFGGPDQWSDLAGELMCYLEIR